MSEALAGTGFFSTVVSDIGLGQFGRAAQPGLNKS